MLMHFDGIIYQWHWLYFSVSGGNVLAMLDHEFKSLAYNFSTILDVNLINIFLRKYSTRKLTVAYNEYENTPQGTT